MKKNNKKKYCIVENTQIKSFSFLKVEKLGISNIFNSFLTRIRTRRIAAEKTAPTINHLLTDAKEV
jgi:hypothetical protein